MFSLGGTGLILFDKARKVSHVHPAILWLAARAPVTFDSPPLVGWIILSTHSLLTNILNISMH